MLLNRCRLVGALSGGVESECGAVEIENGKISAVYDRPKENYEGEVIDCGGKTLLPGLMDTHTHLIGIRYFTADMMRDPMKLFMKTAEVSKRYLDYGFTTLRDCGTPLRVANYVRDAFASGLMTGPRVISSGHIVSTTEIEEADIIYDMYKWGDGPDELMKLVRKELAEHADFVKIMASGSAFHKQGIPVQPIITKREIEAIIEAADLKSAYVASHAHGDGAIRLSIESGVRTVEHASFISDETIEILMGKKNCYLVPTLSAMYQNPAQTPPEMEFLLEKLANMLKLTAGRIKSAYEAGLKLGFATDSTVGMDQYEEGIEFRFRKELCGMKDLDILLQATKYNAEILGIEEENGEIKEGLAADLILVNGKPEQDISVMYHKPEAVFLAGERVR
ncbi:amidohydrolase family protein [Emergencia sp. 1XD21-10]|uniref:metal-dependent hydrolase family protein n=1 Tax=Emergencia sp. 1XD21-10 TaxID=2304569 RepID=UPI001379C27A|nr:amidohydrolase family protein [Emergencia sp. 1XD21-10]NCE97743.1 amidohydrolase family protein [Emergencia sp. 1XD21-10]